jgi:hypothetical protein
LRKFIYDQKTGERIAFIVSDEVFRVPKGSEKIATVETGNIRDLKGKLVGHIEGKYIVGRESSTPLSFRNLLGKGQ